MSVTRAGTPLSPATVTVGAPGVSDQVREFTDSYARLCVVTNTSATDNLYVLVNEEDASDTNFLVKLEATQALDVSFGGRMAVRKVSLFYTTAAYSAAQVRGWV